MNNGFIIVFITVKDHIEAERISQTILTGKLGACVNIVSGIDSSFWWHGKIDSEKENLLIVKTETSLLDELVKSVKQIHSYEVPEIIALPVIGGNPDYFKWIEDSI